MNSIKKIKYCSNCRKGVGEEDKFCRYCGVSVFEREYKPSYTQMMQIYGPPPIKRTHLCEVCGYIWTTFSMIDREKFCPLCGGSAPEQKE